jgi:drug/metabolite transporter (DMT)-like permease
MASALAAAALVFNALIWGVSWWPFRALEAQGLHPLWATVVIYVFVLACLLTVRPGAWRAFGRHPQLWWLVLASGLTNVGFNWAVTVGDVVRVVLLFYLMPAWVTLLAWPLLGERPGVAALARLLLALAGVVIVLKRPGMPWPLPETLADALALGGGFCFALTNILLRKLHQIPDVSRLLAMFGGGATMALGAALLGGQQGLVALPPAPGVVWLGLVALIGVAFMAGNLSLIYGAARLPAGTTALIMLTEVLFASGSSVLLGAAQLSTRIVWGGALILLAALWAAWPTQET